MFARRCPLDPPPTHLTSILIHLLCRSFKFAARRYPLDQKPHIRANLPKLPFKFPNTSPSTHFLNTMSAMPDISFDDDNNVRVLSTAHMKHTEELEIESKLFVQQISEFKTKVTDLVATLSKQGARIEKEKLKAIGQRNKLDGEVEDMQRQQIALHGAVAEKRAELDRYQLQHQSLEKVEAEQLAMIEKLQNQ